MSIVEEPIVRDIKPEQHIGLARHIVSKYVGRNEKIEDTEEYSDALLGLIKAAKTWKPEHGSFSNWAFFVCKNQILMGKKKQDKLKVLETDVAEKVQEQPIELDLGYITDFIDNKIVNGNPQERRNMLLFKQVYIDKIKVADLAGDVSRMSIYNRLEKAKQVLREFIYAYQHGNGAAGIVN